MSSVDLYNSKLEKVGSEKVNFEFNLERVSVPVVHQVVKATLAGRRQGTACTKTKGLVSGGGAKPFKQKGTGRARQGSNRSPLLRGGGTVFGPTPRDYTQKVNKKVMNRAIESVLIDKFNEGKLFVVDKLESDGKTKTMFENLKKAGLDSSLIVAKEKDNKAILASRNLKRARGLAVEGFSVYEALKYQNLIIEKDALNALTERLVQKAGE